MTPGDDQASANTPRSPARLAFLAAVIIEIVVGIFGTIAGVIKAFRTVNREGVDPNEKAKLLADGISKAMEMSFVGFALGSSAA